MENLTKYMKYKEGTVEAGYLSKLYILYRIGFLSGYYIDLVAVDVKDFIENFHSPYDGREASTMFTRSNAIETYRKSLCQTKKT